MFVLPARPVFAGAVFITLTFFSTCSRADSLRDIYELALKNDATLRAAAATFRANQETEKQARSRLLPQIASEASYSANQGLRDAFGNNLSGNTVVTSQIKSQRTTRGTNWDVSPVQGSGLLLFRGHCSGVTCSGVTVQGSGLLFMTPESQFRGQVFYL